MILDHQKAAREEEQKVIDKSPIITLPRLTDALPIKLTRNPTAKRDLRKTPCLHRCVTRNNLLGVTRPATTIEPIPEIPAQTQRPCQKLTTPTQVQPCRGPQATSNAIPSGAHQWIVTRHAVNLLTLQEEASFSTIHTPRALLKHAKVPINFEHYANSMVHLVTGRTISSYKKLMHNPATAAVWQTAFGKDFGGMAQGCNKTGQKDTNAMFVMTHDEIMHALASNKFFTYANPVVNYCPQKDDPHQIHITAGGNLINYKGNASVRKADIDTAKIHWNSVISTPNAKYMCLDIKIFYLTASLKYFEYMEIPLSLFPEWTQEQYNLKQLALDGWVYIEMRRAVWGLPQAGILANKRLNRKLAPFGYTESIITPGLWTHKSRPISFTLVVDDFGVKYVTQDDVDHLITSIKAHTISPRIGREICIGASPLIGTMKTAQWTFPCQDI